MRAEEPPTYNMNLNLSAPNQPFIRSQNGPIMLNSGPRQGLQPPAPQISDNNAEVGLKNHPLNGSSQNRHKSSPLNEGQMLNSGQSNKNPSLKRTSSNMEQNKRYVANENRDSHLPQYLESEQQCDLCRMEFDLSNSVPMMICRNQHNCCLQCAKEVLSRKAECPFCRVQVSINEVKKNRIVANIIENQAKKKGKKLEVSPNPQKQLFDHINGGRFDHNLHGSSVYYPNEGAHMLDSGNASILYLPEDNNNDYAAVRNDSCFSRLRDNLDDGIFIVPMLFTFIYNVPFLICDFIYAFSLEQQKCMDQEYINGFCLRTWLTVSGFLGLSLFLATLFGIVVFVGVVGNRYEKFPRAVAIVILIVQAVKILGWNIFGLVLSGNIAARDQFDCNGSVMAYMKALLYIQIVIGCILLSICNGNR